jgi:ABC-type uncharacterized transport system substrate-binding protein
MKRRQFITLPGGVAAAWSLSARAQRGTRTPRIGVLAPGRSVGADASLATLNSVVTGLRELGYIEGENIAIERGFGEANADRLREVAAEFVGHGLDVIVALSTTAARPLKQAMQHWIIARKVAGRIGHPGLMLLLRLTMAAEKNGEGSSRGKHALHDPLWVGSWLRQEV